MKRPLALMASILLTGGCNRTPDYAPPPQRQPLIAPAAHLGEFVQMKDLIADAYIVRDVENTPEGVGWRWAYRHPQLRFYVEDARDVKFTMDFGLPRTTFQVTGPVVLTIRINDRELARARFDRSGDQHFEKLVPGAWLRPRSENLVAIECDRIWVSPEDGAALMLILYRAGFQ